LLGRATLTSEELAQSKGSFCGELALDSGKEGACIKVTVDSDNASTSMASIGDGVKLLSQRLDSDFEPLLRDMFGQLSEQRLLLQQSSFTPWHLDADRIVTPAELQDDTPPSYPERLGEVQCFSQRSGSGSSTKSKASKIDMCDPDRANLDSAPTAALSSPWPSAMSRV